METVAQLQIVTEFLLRNCKEKDDFIMSCGIQLRLCHCGTVSSKLIDDLINLESKINNKAYKSLFSKTLNSQELQETAINPADNDASTNSTDLTTTGIESSSEAIENIQQDTQYMVDCTTLEGNGSANITILGEDSTIQTIALPPNPGSSTMMITDVPMETDYPLEAAEVISTSDLSEEDREPVATYTDFSRGRTDAAIVESEHVAEATSLDNGTSEVVLQSSAIDSKSSDFGTKSAIVVLEAPQVDKDSSMPIFASDSSEHVVTVADVKATEHHITELASESAGHVPLLTTDFIEASEGTTVSPKVGAEETLATTEYTISQQVATVPSNSQDVPQRYSLLTSESVSDLINSDMHSLTSLNDLNTVAIVAGENGPVFVYEQLCDDGQIIVVTSEEADTNENGSSNEITVLANTASLQQPTSSEADVIESLDERDITEFTTEDEHNEVLQSIEENQVHDTPDRMFVCRLCNKAYRKHTSLKEHMITHDKTRREKYKCSVCGKGFSKPSLLKSHMEHHNRLKPFQCEVCCKRFAQKSCQTRHMKIHTKEKPYACSVCDKRFNQFGHAQKHMNMHADNRHKCSLCPRTFPAFGKLKSHLALHEKLKKTEPDIECNKPVFTKHLPRKELKFSCKYCPEKFAKESELLAHDESHAEDRPFRCEICGYRCLQLKNLKYHKKSHKESANHVCDICGQRFRSAFWLTNHILEHKGEKSFMCEDCGEVFTLQCMLTRHRVRRHGVKPIHKCKSCGLVCPSLKALKHHRAKAHRDMRLKYGCKKCPERFSAIQLLVQHLKSHIEVDKGPEDQKQKDEQTEDSIKEEEENSKEKPPVGKTSKRRRPCPICGQQLHPGSISKHVQAHGGSRLSAPVTKTGQRRTPCTVCNQLISETSVYTHMRLHKRKGEVEEKPPEDDGKHREPCEVCGKMFVPQSLPKHRLLHLSERPFSCDVCGKRFSQKQNVTRHKKARHPES